MAQSTSKTESEKNLEARANASSNSAQASTNTQLITPLSSLLKAAGDELRLNILRVLSRDSYGVLELCEVFQTKQSALSHHLKVLANAGLVTTRREGNSIFYRRAHTIEPQSLYALQQSIFQTADYLELNENLQAGIAAVQQERTQNSQRFFSENANKFKAQQDLIASIDQYGPAISEILDTLPNKTQAIEIGPGSGSFLPELCKRFKHVHAIDNNSDMLNQCQALIDAHNIQNIELVLGDTSNTQFTNSADAIAVNMVLHHTPAPAEILQDLSTMLKSGGSLIICDLISHDQSWARENCGDVWLGFDEEELSEWAQAAGLTPSQETYLTLRNGFRIQVRQFINHSN